MLGIPAFAALAVSSAVSGTWYGTRDWRAAPERRLIVLLSLFAAGTLPLVAATNVPTLVVAAVGLGLTMAPTFITGFAIVHRVVAPAHLTEGLAWMVTISGLGISLGTVLAGQILDNAGTTATFTAASMCAVLVLPAAFAVLHGSRPAAGEP